ncbi:MAG: FG-GAP-like repeat-containing protein, partial [Acidimicrobiia bacterium]|nr:FG-GAP-like repeat-containing protein [Acidimicrobiia bacterium]
ITWHENDGSQNFTEHTISTQALGARSVYATDVDADGDIDVLSASADDDTIAWYENDGTQGFTERLISTTADGARSVYAADVDGDGDVDVLSASANDDTIAWYENDGSQSFTERVISTTADGSASVHVADVDDDGDIDILSASEGDDTIAWYENDGTQNFSAHPVSSTADGASAAHAADVDLDGDIDLLSASANDNKVAWYENDGAQNFTVHAISTSADGGRSVHSADVDGDGDMDVLSASEADDKIAWYENDGAQGFIERVITTSADGAGSIFATDVDLDGDIDVLSASALDDRVAWHENRTIHHSATFPSETVISTTALGARWVSAEDMDGDGDVDVLSASRDDDKIAWYENDGDQGFSEHLISSSAIQARSVYVTDIDRDGDVDALSASIQDSKIAWYENRWNEPTMDFAGYVISQSALNARSAFAVDVDGDGDIDVLSASQSDDKIAWYENDGSQNFSEHAISLSADDARMVYAADLDNDGDVDVMSASASDSKIAWYENRLDEPTADFQERVITTAAASARAVFAADVDSDGDVDVLSTAIISDEIAWWENRLNEPTGDFAGSIISTSADFPNAVYAMDVDGDGDTDVLSASVFDDTIAWYENDGSQNFTDHVISTNAGAAHSVFAVDVDGDGDTDVLSASEFDDKIAWYENQGGQFSFASTGIAPPVVCDGEAVPLLAIDLAHLGRDGDSAEELTTLDLRLLEGPGDPLSSVEANALIDSLRIYRDDGSGVLDAGDALLVEVLDLTLVAGVETVILPDGNTDAQVLSGSTATFFVAAQIASGATGAVPNQFQVEQDVATSTVEDAAEDILVRGSGSSSSTGTGTVTAVCEGNCSDADGDGYGVGTGCTGADCDDGVASCTTDCSDSDGDGVRACDGDCQDANSDVFPGAPETCDGVDNQCPGDAGHGLVDEGGNALCDNGQFCDGSETCGGVAGCQSSVSVDCNDGSNCTVDACNETTDSCDYTNSGTCSVSGTVYYYRNFGAEPTNKPVPDVEVDLSSGTTADGAMDDVTDSNGAYSLPSQMGTINISLLDKFGATGAEDTNGAISALDAAVIAQEAASIVTAHTPMSDNQLTAADVTGSGDVSGLDAARVAQHVAGISGSEHFPIAIQTGSDWALLRCDNYVDAENEDCANPVFTHDPIGQPEIDDFYAILYGEVTGNWQPATSANTVPGSDEQPSGASGSRGGLDGFFVEDTPEQLGALEGVTMVPFDWGELRTVVRNPLLPVARLVTRVRPGTAPGR